MARFPTARRPSPPTLLLCGLLLAGVLAPTPALAQLCERPVCRSDERYVRRVTSDGESYGVCESGPNWLGHRSHRIAACPSGFTLNTSTGQCVDDGCGSGCGQTRPVCPYGTTFRRQEEGREGPYAVCESRSGAGYISHQIVRCREGWQLIAGGQCRKECLVVAAPIVSPMEPAVVLRPDLVITRAYLRTRASATPLKMVPRGRPYLACFTVANQGNAASRPFRVEGGGLGVASGPYQNHAGLPVGASREGCLEYSTTPAPGSYTLGLTADSRNVVAESREDNNTRRLAVTVSR